MRLAVLDRTARIQHRTCRGDLESDPWNVSRVLSSGSSAEAQSDCCSNFEVCSSFHPTTHLRPRLRRRALLLSAVLCQNTATTLALLPTTTAAATATDDSDAVTVLRLLHLPTIGTTTLLHAAELTVC